MSARNLQDMIHVYDADGRLHLIDGASYRDHALLQAFDEARDDPERLYDVIVSALSDGFFEGAVSPARRLLEIDGSSERATNVVGLALMRCGNLVEAEAVYEGYLATGAESGPIRTNLAKVYSDMGDDSRATEELWTSLCVDPNQENGLTWWAAIHRDANGEDGFQAAIDAVAALPGSWRAQLWQARRLIGQGHIVAAISLYEFALPQIGDDGTALTMISGDLGNAGRFRESVDIVAPDYEPGRHGADAGFNLVTSYIQLGEFDRARAVLAAIAALGRHDLQAVTERLNEQLDKASASA